MFYKYDEIFKKDRLVDFIKFELKIINILIKVYIEYVIYMNKNLFRFYKFSIMYNFYFFFFLFVLMCISLFVCVCRCVFRCEFLLYILVYFL